MYQRNLTVPPRLAREGFAPAGPEKRPNRRNMLIPKMGRRSAHIPKLIDYSEILCPPERRAMREIVAVADVIHEDSHDYLVARVSPDTLDILAVFETSREDLEDGADRTSQPRGRLVGSGLGRRPQLMDKPSKGELAP